MRYSSQHKQETRFRVLKEAASAIRAKGPDGVAVTDIMARAGLTHGGFYAHFASKNELVGEAIVTMFDEVRDRMTALGDSGDAKTSLRNILSYYLSAEHRDNPAGGCPMPALSGDLTRTTGDTRTCFTQGVSDMAARITTALKSIGIENAECEANALQAQLVGAVALARAVDSASLSDAILQDTLAQIASRFGLDGQ
jgi:TetR/AcrR family transcriptional regulator, transcriptional repressor for nem operon